MGEKQIILILLFFIQSRNFIFIKGKFYKNGAYYLISTEYYIDRVKSQESNYDVYQKIGSDDEAIGKAWPWSDGEIVMNIYNVVAIW